MIFKKSLISVCFGMALVSSFSGYANAAQDNGWSISDSNKVAGDDAYWGSSSDDQTPQTAKYDEGSIYADQMRKADKDAKSEVPPIRAEAIQSAAAAFGAQAGLASRADKINKALERNSASYDKVFNFNALQIEPGFLPPVISEGRDAYNQPNDDEVRAADTIYKIETPARIVNVVPRWQQYLFVAFTNPTLPDSSLMPKNSSEKELWDQWAKKGWDQGVEQADNSFNANRGRLKRDFEGMIRFKRLYEQGLVVKPTIARSELGVTGGGDEMAVGDRLIKITTKAQLNPDAKRWSSSNPK